MALGHVSMGAAAGAVFAPLLPTPAEQAGWVILCMGAAIVSDLDQSGSTIGRMWGPFTGGLRVKILGRRRLLVPGIAWLIGKAARGHRKGTHDWLVAPPALAVAAWVATFWWWGQVGVMALVIGLSLRAVDATLQAPLARLAGRILRWLGFRKVGRLLLGRRQPWDDWMLTFILSWGGAYVLVDRGLVVPTWVPAAFALGVLVHIVGDRLTKQGTPTPLSWLEDRPVYVSWTSWSASSRLLNGTVSVLSSVLIVVLSWTGVDVVGPFLAAWRSL